MLHFRLGVSGVATATLCSESAKFLALAALAASAVPARLAWPSLRQSETWNLGEIAPVLRLNRDLFGRTLLLMAAVLLLTRAGARQGSVILATNAIFYQLFILSALLLDGFESAAQVLCGGRRRAPGRRPSSRAWSALPSP